MSNTVAAIQMNSGSEVAANLTKAAHLIQQAVDQGATLVVLPENFALLSSDETIKVVAKEKLGDGPIQSFLAEQSSQHQIHLVGGTIPICSERAEKVYAASLVYDRDGQCVAHYNKIHLFDVNVNDGEESYCESSSTVAGDEVVVVDTPCGKLGLSVCYDVRFPELYRAMLVKGVEILSIPAAFTATTGAVHWEVLLRARAIENLSYVIAPNQVGQHGPRRQTYGHSMIVDPWGDIVSGLNTDVGFVTAQIDLQRLNALRQRFPAIEHRKI